MLHIQVFVLARHLAAVISPSSVLVSHKDVYCTSCCEGSN